MRDFFEEIEVRVNINQNLNVIYSNPLKTSKRVSINLELKQGRYQYKILLQHLISNS